MELQTVTDLVNKLFTYYECTFNRLDWDDKIDEYVDAISDFISLDTDLDAVYKKIRQDYPYRKLPLPHDIKKLLQKSKTRQEIKEYTEHPDNGKKVVVVCYRNGIARELREYVICNTPETKAFSEITNKIKEDFDNYKIYEFGKDTTIYHGCTRLADGTIQATGEAWLPKGYNDKGEITGWDKRKIA